MQSVLKVLHTKEDYEKVFEILPDIIFTLSREGVITSLNSYFEEVTGWSRKKWIGENFSKFVYPDDLPFALKTFKEALQGKKIGRKELRIKAQNGRILTFEFALTLQKSPGKTIGIAGVARNVTLHKEEEKMYLHYANLVESADSGIISRDLNGKIISWNKAAEKLFGYKSKEIVGKDVRILFPPGRSGEFDEINTNIKKGRSIEEFETVRVTKSGKRIAIVAKLSAIRDRNGIPVGLSVFMRDNSTKLEEERREKFLADATKILSSSLDYQSTLKKLTDVVIPKLADCLIINILDEKGKVLRVALSHRDPKLTSLIKSQVENISKSKGISRGFSQVLKTGKPELYRLITQKKINKAVKDKRLRTLLAKKPPTSALIVPILSRKKILGVISFISTSEKRFDKNFLKSAEELGRRAGHAIDNSRLYNDSREEVEKRKKIEAELRQSRDNLEIVLKNIGDGIVLQNPKGKVVFINDVTREIIGKELVEDMIKNTPKFRALFDLKYENGGSFSSKILPSSRALKGETDAQEVVTVLNKKTGIQKYLFIKARPVFGEWGKVRAVVTIIHDITQIKDAERKKDDFISITSHELKTPVTSIKGFVHVLKKEAENKDQRSFDFLKKIDFQLNKLTELIEDLLDLTKVRSGKLEYRIEKFDITSVINMVVDDMQKTSRSHKIILKNGDCAKILGDRERISQVLINLINNAIKYSPKSREVLILVKINKKNIEVIVKDSGIGISEDEIDKIFERFYRVKDSVGSTFPGLGIGLYLSREIILRHKGKIWAESKKGIGSKFHFTLPLAN